MTKSGRRNANLITPGRQPSPSTAEREGTKMRKSSKIALRALIAGVVLFVVALPFSKNGWEKTTGGTLFFLSVLAAVVFLISGVYSVATKNRAGAGARAK